MMFTIDDSELRKLAVDLERESPRVGREKFGIGNSNGGGWR